MAVVGAIAVVASLLVGGGTGGAANARGPSALPVASSRTSGPTDAAPSLPTTASRPTPLPLRVESRPAGETPNGSLGAVAFTWVLSNGTVDSGAVNQRYELSPDQLLYLPATDELWAAFAIPALGASFNTTVQNLSDGATDILNGVGNVTGMTYDPALGDVVLTQIPPGGTTGQLLSFGVRSHELARTPTTVQAHPTDVAVEPDSGALWVTGWTSVGSNGSVTVVSEPSGLVHAVVPVGVEPTAVAFDPSENLAYVADSGSENLTILEESDGARVGTVPVPGKVAPGALAFDNATGSFVMLAVNASLGTTSLLGIDPSNDRVTDLGALPGNATGSTLAIDPGTGDAYVATERVNGSAAGGGELLRWSFAASSWTVAGVVGLEPDRQSLDPTTDLDFVGHENQGYVSVVNVSQPNGPPRIIEFGGGPQGGAFDPTDGRVYVVNSYDGGSAGTAPDTLDAIAPAAATPAVPVGLGAPGTSSLGSDPSGVADDPSSGSLFVADRGWSAATVLSAASGTFAAEFFLPFAPVAVADDPVRGLVFFASDAGEVAAFHTANRTLDGRWNLTAPSLAWNASFEGLTVDPSTGTLLGITPDLGPTGVSGVWTLDPQNGSQRFEALGPVGAGSHGDYPSAIAFDSADGDAYVATDSGAVDVIDPANDTVLANATVGVHLSAIAFEPVQDLVVAADPYSGTLRVLNGSSPGSVNGTPVVVPAGPDPQGITIDPALDQLVVSDYGSATLDAFSTVPEVGSLTVHVTIPTVGALPGVTSVDDVGRPVLFVALAGGGRGPLTFGYANLPPGCPTSNASQLFCEPTGSGTFGPTVTVVDASLRTAEAGTLLTVEPAPTVNATAAPDPVDEARANVTIAAVFAGGVGPFRYAVGFDDGSPSENGTVSANGVVLVHTYRGPAAYNVTISIVDALQATASATLPVVLGAPMVGTAEAIPLASRSPPLSLAFRAQVSGGVAPYTYAWVCSAGVQVVSSASNRSTVTETFAHSGPESVEVWVNDSAHASLLLFANATVPAPPPHAAPSLLPWLALATGLGVAAAVVGVVVYRRKGPSKRTPPNSSA